MIKLFVLVFVTVVLTSCDVSGVKNPKDSIIDTVETLSSVDSAFVNLKKEFEPVKPDTVKDDLGLPLVWNGKDGLRIEWTIRSQENQINNNDLVLANYEARVARAQVFDSNRGTGAPLPLKLGIGQLIKGWEKALLQMSVGDKGRIMIPSKLAYGDYGYQGKVPRNADIIVEIEIVGKIEPETLSEGVKVYKYKSVDTTFPTPAKNQNVTFDYFTYKKGINPGLYDNSYSKGTPFTVKFENDNVVNGLHQGLSIMRQGEHAFIEIPSNLAYGKSGIAELVPPNTDIVFDLRIESIK
ncbi:MAG: FKBP-type peptidyl-prolyl cis-trans isomerase [Crocinitomicaceae bacterium]